VIEAAVRVCLIAVTAAVPPALFYGLWRLSDHLVQPKRQTNRRT